MKANEILGPLVMDILSVLDDCDSSDKFAIFEHVFSYKESKDEVAKKEHLEQVFRLLQIED